MTLILSLYTRVFTIIDQFLGSWFIPTLARFAFIAVLLTYFWNSALTKVSDGLFGFLTPSDNAYIQIFPKTFEAVGYDSSALNSFHWLVAVAGICAEFILPFLILIGLLARLASLGMIGFVLVQSYVDINGHGVAGADLGAWFDGPSGSLILDQRLLWMVLFLVMFTKGAGPLSVDRLLCNFRKTYA